MMKDIVRIVFFISLLTLTILSVGYFICTAKHLEVTNADLVIGLCISLIMAYTICSFLYTLFTPSTNELSKKLYKIAVIISLFSWIVGLVILGSCVVHLFPPLTKGLCIALWIESLAILLFTLAIPDIVK